MKVYLLVTMDYTVLGVFSSKEKALTTAYSYVEAANEETMVEDDPEIWHVIDNQYEISYYTMNEDEELIDSSLNLFHLTIDEVNKRELGRDMD